MHAHWANISYYLCIVKRMHIHIIYVHHVHIDWTLFGNLNTFSAVSISLVSHHLLLLLLLFHQSSPANSAAESMYKFSSCLRSTAVPLPQWRKHVCCRMVLHHPLLADWLLLFRAFRESFHHHKGTCVLVSIITWHGAEQLMLMVTISSNDLENHA